MSEKSKGKSKRNFEISFLILYSLGFLAGFFDGNPISSVFFVGGSILALVLVVWAIFDLLRKNKKE